MSPKSLSIVVVTYNSANYIDACLDSLEGASAQWNGDLEVIVVDNASSDDTTARVSRRNTTTLLENKDNRGFAAGANRGIRSASGTWVMVLNPDTTCDPSFIRTLMTEVEPYDAHLINPLILCPDGSINAAGLSVHYTGISTCQALGEDPAGFLQYDAIPIASPSGAAIIAHRRVWDALGGFDEQYFLYMEDVDLGLRAYCLGYASVCLPRVHVFHDYRLRLTPQKLYYLERNRLLLVRKLYSKDLRHRIAWGLMLTSALSGAFSASRGWVFLRAFIEAHLWFWRRPTLSQNPKPLTHLLPSMDTPLPLGTTAALPQLAVRMINALYRRRDNAYVPSARPIREEQKLL